MDKDFDAIIIGGGPNGLTAGAYLAKAGLKVLVLENRHEMGGGLATEEITVSGYYHNTHAIYMMMTDYAPAYNDLEMERLYGLEHIYPPLQFAMPFDDGNCIGIYSDLDRTCKSFSKFSEKDAKTYRDLYKKFEEWMKDFIGPYTYVQPKSTLEIAGTMDGIEMGREMSAMTEKTPRELIDDWFENDQVKALMLNTICYWGLDPEQSGLGYLVPLYINRSNQYRICKGGTHKLAQALIKVILKNGGMCLTRQKINKIIVDNGTAKGVERDDGVIFNAKAIVSTLDMDQTFLSLVGQDHLEGDFIEGVNGWLWEHWSLLGIHLALLDRPRFKLAENNPEMDEALIYILGCETAEDYLRHQEAIGKGDVKPGSIISCTFPTVHDPSQVRISGTHTAIVQQQVPFDLTNSQSWDSFEFREEVASTVIATARKYFPNMTDEIIRKIYISSPLDIQNKFNDMVKGSLKQGQYHPLQMGYMRPNYECSRHRSPIKRLYMGGACTYPGGTVLLASGYLAADAVVEDMGVEKWWPEPDSVRIAREKGVPCF